MTETFNSLFDIYPDRVCKGAVDAYRRPDGTLLEFPCTLETENAVKDKKGRWTASGLGLIPSVCRYSEDLKLSTGKEAWIGRGFGETPESEQWFDNPDLFENDTFECIRFIFSGRRKPRWLCRGEEPT